MTYTIFVHINVYTVCYVKYNIDSKYFVTKTFNPPYVYFAFTDITPYVSGFFVLKPICLITQNKLNTLYRDILS